MSAKTLVMIVALAAVTGAVTGCFSLFGRPATTQSPSLETSCEGLIGQPLEDCNSQNSSLPR